MNAGCFSGIRQTLAVGKQPVSKESRSGEVGGGPSGAASASEGVPERLPSTAVVEIVPSESFASMPPCQLLSNPEIMSHLCVLFSRAKKTIYGKQYSMDHSEAFSLLEIAVRRNVEVRIVHDRGKFEHPACAYQNDRLRTLAKVAREYGKDELFRFRAIQPVKFGAGGFNSQHSKTWIVDGEIYADGSANLTGQSMKNLESVLVTRVRTVLEKAQREFADAWEEATEVPYERLLALP